MYLQERSEGHRDPDASTFLVGLRLLGTESGLALLRGAKIHHPKLSYSLLAGFSDVLVGVEEGPNVYCLTAPDMTMDRPI